MSSPLMVKGGPMRTASRDRPCAGRVEKPPWRRPAPGKPRCEPGLGREAFHRRLVFHELNAGHQSEARPRRVRVLGERAQALHQREPCVLRARRVPRAP